MNRFTNKNKIKTKKNKTKIDQYRKITKSLAIETPFGRQKAYFVSLFIDSMSHGSD